MCYSLESSIITTFISFISIIILLSSGMKKYKWLAITLIGWCGMQFAEMILWSTKPGKKDDCHIVNKIVSFSLIPLVLFLQPLGSLYGSFYEISWDKSSMNRKIFIIFYTMLIITFVSIYFFVPLRRTCTVVTNNGHLNWTLSSDNKNSSVKPTYLQMLMFSLWGFLIILPLIIYWKNKYEIILICLPGLIGLIYGLFYTDSKASVWCFITTFSSLLFILMLLAEKYIKLYPFS